MMKIYLNLRTVAISLGMAAFFLLINFSGIQAQNIIKVKTDGQAYVDYTSHSTWVNATSDLQAAIDGLAANGGGEIWVAGGTYYPSTHFSADPQVEDNLGETPSDQYRSFVIRNGVTILGGFEGTETDLSERPDDPIEAGSATTLSGDIGVTDDFSDNSFHVVIFPLGTDNSAVLDGLIITKGNANDGTTFNGRGGGIHARNGGLARNCLITDNRAAARGGGAYLFKGGELNNCAITQNETDDEGGGVTLNLGGMVTHSAILENTAGSLGTSTGEGGGAFLISDDTDAGTVEYSLIMGNLTGDKGGGVGVFETGTNGHPGGNVLNNLIANNKSGGNGGGVHTQTAGYLLNNTIVRNEGDRGAGVFSDSGGTLINSVLWGNVTTSTTESDLQFETGGSDPNAASADYCAIQNGTESSIITNLISLEPDNTGSTGLYPYFLSPASFSGLPSGQAQIDEIEQSDYRMDLPSDLIDEGDPNSPTGDLQQVDLYGNPRITQSNIDMGAYETYYHIVTTEVINGTGGTLMPEQPVEILHGENITFTLTPEGTNEVVSFQINSTEYKDQLTEVSTNTFEYTSNVTEDQDATAEFGVPSFLSPGMSNDIRVYPNPARHHIFIEGVEIRELTIYSINGQTIKHLQHPSSQINISDLRQGLYFIEIEDSQQKKHLLKFIKQ